MYLSRMIVDPAGVYKAGMYDSHQALWRAFSDGPERKRDFLYRAVDRHTFLAVSSREPRDDSGLWRGIKIRDYAPRLSKGDRLMFSLRVNPVRKTRKDGKQVRYDIVQDLWMKKYKPSVEDGKRENAPNRLQLAEEAGLTWLESRQEQLGFALDKAAPPMAESYEHHKFRKRGSGRRVTLATLDLRGFLHVTDVPAFERTLFNGIGCAKGFGCGLMLVRRA